MAEIREAVKDLSDANFKDLLPNPGVAVVDIYASWCGSCRLFAPTFKEIAEQHPQYSFFKIDGEKNPAFCEGVAIDNLPFVAVFSDGQYVGGQSLTKKEALESMMHTIRERSGR